MKIKYHDLIIFLGFSVITFLYSFYIFSPNLDEIWNYGFAYNIYNGLVPYRDFNMIIPPMFAFTIIPFFWLFGSSLFSFHLYVAIIVGLIILMMYKTIKYKAFLIFPIIILGYLPSYNLFCVFLFLILVLINDGNSKYKDIYLGIIIALIFLTKQTVGACLIIPCLFYSKKKIKTLISFMIPIFLFSIYLIINNAFLEFIDYCFLGLFSFAEKNGTFTFNSIIIILLCLFLGYKLIKNKFQNKIYFYGLMFQVVALPIGDIHHFFIAISVIVYVLLTEYNLSKIMYIYLLLFLYLTMSSITIGNAFSNGFDFSIDKEHELYYGRNLQSNFKKSIYQYEEVLGYVNKIEYDNLFVLASGSYFFKLSQKQELNKFDLINNGNMGYKAEDGYINDIKNICLNSKCVFIVEKYSSNKIRGQANDKILKYPEENYGLIYSLERFDVYIN